MVVFFVQKKRLWSLWPISIWHRYLHFLFKFNRGSWTASAKKLLIFWSRVRSVASLTCLTHDRFLLLKIRAMSLACTHAVAASCNRQLLAVALCGWGSFSDWFPTTSFPFHLLNWVDYFPEAFCSKTFFKLVVSSHHIFISTVDSHHNWIATSVIIS